jgi:hypothetical protein
MSDKQKATEQVREDVDRAHDAIIEFRRDAGMNRRPIDKDTLEAIIDLHSLTDVVTMLSEICALKAEHINFHWQDNKLTKKWHRAGFQLYQLAANLPKLW